MPGRKGAGERAREIRDKLKSEGRAFSDSADLIRWGRETITPEDAADWIADPSTRRDDTAREFAERFIARRSETFER